MKLCKHPLKKKRTQIKKRPKRDLFDQKGLSKGQGLLKKDPFWHTAQSVSINWTVSDKYPDWDIEKSKK